MEIREFCYVEMKDYYVAVFKLDTVPFYALVDRATLDVISIETCTYGQYHDINYSDSQKLIEIPFLKDYFYNVAAVIQELFRRKKC